MQETFVELVPRSQESLLADIQSVEAMDIPFHGYNFPELKRSTSTFLTPEEMMRMRSEGRLCPSKKLALHVRTQERNVADNVARIRSMATHGVTIALLVTGDAFDPEKEPATCAHTVLEQMQKPIENIEIAVDADLYMDHWGRWKRKKDAMQRGIVSSVFTQPIFHADTLNNLQQETQHVAPEKIYAGVTWITNSKSRDYWQTMNNVPSAFLPAGETDETIRSNSISQSADMLRLIRQQGFSQYIMLMRGKLQELQHIFSLSENIREY